MPTNDATTVIVKAFPTPKEQIVSGLIGLALTGAVIGTAYVGFAIADKVSTVRAARKAKKDSTVTE